MNCVTRQTQFTPVDQHNGPLSLKPNLIHDLCDLLLKMTDGGQPLSVRIFQPIISSFINARAPRVLGKFKVTLKWIHAFMKTHLDWNYRHATTICGKLPADWRNQGLHMAYRATYLVKAYDQPLIINTNYTCMTILSYPHQKLIIPVPWTNTIFGTNLW